MSEPKFTPGPWKMHPVRGGHRHRAECIRIVNAERESVVCVQADEVGETTKGLLVEHVSSTAEANARLIAAAPELYAALRELRDAWCLNACDAASPDDESNHLPECYAARDAIRKAVGS